MTSQMPSQNWPESDPVPSVPTPEAIQFAEQLRHQLELRMLAGNHSNHAPALSPGELERGRTA